MNEINRRFFESLMQEKNLSLRGLAAKIGLGHSQLSLTFSGGRRLTIEEAAQLSQIFGVPIHRIIEAAGVTTKPYHGKRVPVIGAMDSEGTVELYGKGVMERTDAPDLLPDNAAAVQCRTAGTSLDWMDGFVMFFRQADGIYPGHLGRFCLCQIKDGPAVVGTLKRGYRDGTVNISGPYHQDSAPLAWATPILITRN